MKVATKCNKTKNPKNKWGGRGKKVARPSSGTKAKTQRHESRAPRGIHSGPLTTRWDPKDDESDSEEESEPRRLRVLYSRGYGTGCALTHGWRRDCRFYASRAITETTRRVRLHLNRRSAFVFLRYLAGLAFLRQLYS